MGTGIEWGLIIAGIGLLLFGGVPGGPILGGMRAYVNFRDEWRRRFSLGAPWKRSIMMLVAGAVLLLLAIGLAVAGLIH